MRTISLLYVDDEPSFLNIFKLYLERSGKIRVATAGSAKEGIRALEDSHCDIIVSDYQMPVMDGLQFLKYVRERYDDLPFIIFTGRGREEVVIEALNSGADFYLQKGGDPKSQFLELEHKILQAFRRKTAEEALARGEVKYRTLVEDAVAGIATTDVVGRLSYVNQALCSMLGKSREEILGAHFSELLHPDDASRIRDMFSAAGTETSQNELKIEFRALHKDGYVVYMFSHPRVLRYRGEIIGFSAVILDISERKHAEEEIRGSYEQLAAAEEVLKRQYMELQEQKDLLQKSESFFSNIFSSIQDGICILDRDMTILRVNMIMEQWYSHAAPLVGKKCYEVYQGCSSPCSNCPARITLESGKPAKEVVPMMKDGVLTGWIELYSYPLIEQESGEMEGIVSYVRNITEQKMFEDALRDSEMMFRTVVNAAKDSIFIKDSRMRYSFVNLATVRLFSKPLEEILGKTDEELFGPQLAGPIIEIDRRVLAGERVEEENIKPPLDPTRTFHMIKTPIRNGEGVIVALAGIARDVTARMAAGNKGQS